MILLDTSVLSQVFRRSAAPPASAVILRFTALVESGLPLTIPGVVYQEILSGLRGEKQFRQLVNALEGFPLLLSERLDHLEASRLVNLLRRHGIAASSFDALIAAMAIRRDAILYTLDADFDSFARLVSLKLLDHSAKQG